MLGDSSLPSVGIQFTPTVQKPRLLETNTGKGIPSQHWEGNSLQQYRNIQCWSATLGRQVLHFNTRKGSLFQQKNHHFCWTNTIWPTMEWEGVLWVSIGVLKSFLSPQKHIDFNGGELRILNRYWSRVLKWQFFNITKSLWHHYHFEKEKRSIACDPK